MFSTRIVRVQDAGADDVGTTTGPPVMSGASETVGSDHSPVHSHTKGHEMSIALDRTGTIPIDFPITGRYFPVMRSDGPALMPIFRSQHQAELLTWLLLHPDEEYGVTELATQLNVPLSTLHREIVRLDQAGLVTSRTLGRNRLVSADTDHPAAPALTSLLEITFGPRAIIADEFRIPGTDHVVIFGSWAARYNGTSGPSPRDIDVLVIGAVDRTEVYEAADRAQDRLGIEVNPVIRSIADWNDPQDELVQQIRSSAHVIVLDDQTTRVI